MIDFHTHILPGIDDGSKNVNETFELIKEAEEAGFDKIISTSHYIEDYYEAPHKEREVWINAINEKLNTGIAKTKVYVGSEIYISDKIVKYLEEGKASTINNSSYVLFELPMNIFPMDLNDILFEMMGYKLVPVLAHPERYSFVKKNPDIVYDLIEKGVLIQSNFGSIIGQYGTGSQIIVTKLLENNMVHFLGSDVHKPNTVYANMPEILEKLRVLIGEEKLNEITTVNPELVLNNKRIDIAEPSHIKLSFKEKLMMNVK